MAMCKGVLGSAVALFLFMGPVALAQILKGPKTRSGGSPKPAAAAAKVANAGGTVEGSFTVNGKTVPLKHVYALVKPDDFRPEIDVLVVYFTDVPVAESKLREEYGLDEDASSGKVHAIAVKFNDEAQPMVGHLYNNNLTESPDMSVSGMHKFVPRQFEPGKIIAGKLSVTDGSFFSEKWSYSATFSAPIVGKPKSKPGTAADLNSPPAQAVLAFVAAIKAKDKEAVKKTVMPEMATQLDGPEGPAALDMMYQMLSSKLTITQVVMDGEDRAKVKLENKSEHVTVTMSAAKINGEWRVAPN
jgi:hypothetical protein